MVFKNVFKSAKDFSGMGDSIEGDLKSYIPKEPAEKITQPPHDPFLPFTSEQQDPKIIRETSPQSSILFDFVRDLTQLIGSGSDECNTAFNDPKTTTDIASSIMNEANKKTKSYPDQTPDPKKNNAIKTELPDVDLPPVNRKIPKPDNK